MTFKLLHAADIHLDSPVADSITMCPVFRLDEGPEGDTGAVRGFPT